jgi:hypothetical protein
MWRWCSCARCRAKQQEWWHNKANEYRTKWNNPFRRFPLTVKEAAASITVFQQAMRGVAKAMAKTQLATATQKAPVDTGHTRGDFTINWNKEGRIALHGRAVKDAEQYTSPLQPLYDRGAKALLNGEGPLDDLCEENAKKLMGEPAMFVPAQSMYDERLNRGYSPPPHRAIAPHVRHDRGEMHIESADVHFTMETIPGIDEVVTDEDGPTQRLIKKLRAHPNVQEIDSLDIRADEFTKIKATAHFIGKHCVRDAERFKDGLLDGSLFDHGVLSTEINVHSVLQERIGAT